MGLDYTGKSVCVDGAAHCISSDFARESVEAMRQLLCPKCHKKLRVDEAQAGEVITCPGCQGRFRLPRAKEPGGTSAASDSQSRPGPNAAALSPLPRERRHAEEDSAESPPAHEPVKRRRRKGKRRIGLSLSLCAWLGFALLTIITLVILGLGFFFEMPGEVPGFYFLALIVIAPLFAMLSYRYESGNWSILSFFFSAEVFVGSLVNFVRYPQVLLTYALAFGVLIGSAVISNYQKNVARARNNNPNPGVPNPGDSAVSGDPGSAEPGLRAHWPFDEGKGTKALDSSSVQLEATLHGCEWVDGVKGKALHFNGTSDYVSLATAKPLTFADRAPFTIAAWVKTTSPTGYVLSFRRDPDAPHFDLLNVFVEGGKLAVWVRSRGNPLPPDQITSKAAVNDGKWHHFAVTRSPEGEVGLYFDGALHAELKQAPGRRIPHGKIVTNLHTLGVEARSVIDKRGPPRLNGSLDEFYIWGNVLGADEIRKHASS